MSIISVSGRINSGKDTVGLIIQYLIWKSNVEKDSGALMNYKLDHFRTMGDQLSGWKIKKFADKLKDMACMLLGCTREQLEDRDFKEKELGEEWWYYKLGGTPTKIVPRGYFPNKEDNDMAEARYLVKLTPRLLLQLLGTDCGRNIIHPNIWVNSLMSEYISNNIKAEKILGNKSTEIDLKSENDFPNWIITDLRFPNEYKAIKDKGGTCIKITRKVREFIPGFVAEYNPLLDGKEHESETALDHISDWDYVIDNSGTIEELVEKVRTILVNEKII